MIGGDYKMKKIFLTFSSLRFLAALSCLRLVMPSSYSVDELYREASDEMRFQEISRVSAR
jgi:hypothetical protein